MNNNSKNSVMNSVKNSAKCFMAFGKGVESKESAPIKRFVGIAPVTVLAVNPTKKELEAIYGTTIENEPEYLKDVQNDEGKTIKQLKVDFIVETDEAACGESIISKVTFFINDSYKMNRDKSKVQIIDKYARTAWVTKEQCKNHEIPVYSNGPANIDKDYRPVITGEEELTMFIKAFLSIPDVMRYTNDKWVLVDTPEDSECRFADVKKFFTGDITEIKEAIAIRPNNKVKVMFGVRTTDDGKQYQTIYNRVFMKLSSKSTKAIEKDLNDRKAAGAFATTEFSVEPLHEYIVASTNLSTSSNAQAPAADPFASDSSTHAGSEAMPWD